jgi:hypothetical protein
MSGFTARSNGDDNELDTLELRMRGKRDDVDRYLRTTSMRRGRLVRVTIVAGAIAAALTAAPAFGGKPFSDWLTATLTEPLPAWRVLCAVAAVCSIAATVATQLHRSKNYDENIVRAQSVRATLEALEIGILSGHLSRREAIVRFMNCVENAAFLDAYTGLQPR